MTFPLVERILRTLAAASLGLALAFAGAASMAQTITDGGTLRAALTPATVFHLAPGMTGELQITGEARGSGDRA